MKALHVLTFPLYCVTHSAPQHSLLCFTAGRKKLKRRAARDDSSESGNGQDPGNQLVQYQGAGAIGGNDFLSSLMGLDGLGDSGDSTELHRNQPNLMEVGSAADEHLRLGTLTRLAFVRNSRWLRDHYLSKIFLHDGRCCRSCMRMLLSLLHVQPCMRVLIRTVDVSQVGSALGSMSLDRPDLAGNVWPSSVRIQEHDHVPAAVMPAIPSQPASQPARGVPRVSSTPMAGGATPNGSGSDGGIPVGNEQQQQQQQPVSAGLPAGMPMMDELPSMDLGGDLGAMPNSLDGLSDMTGLSGLGGSMNGGLGGGMGSGIGGMGGLNGGMGGLGGDVTSLFGSDAGLPGGAEATPPLTATGASPMPQSRANYNIVRAPSDLLNYAVVMGSNVMSPLIRCTHCLSPCS